MELVCIASILFAILLALVEIRGKLGDLSAAIYFLSLSVENSARHITSHQEKSG